MDLSLGQKLTEHFTFLYGETQSGELSQKTLALLEKHQLRRKDSAFDKPVKKFSEADSILITYGDSIQEAAQPTLQTLRKFLDSYLGEKINTLHILPFFPYSSDDGFSVIDYRKIDPQLGTWHDIRALANSKKLMIDAVINHISRESEWFQGYLNGDPKYQNYFITVDSSWDLSKVVRPRTSPLLTEVETINGPKKVWTTFSADQIDLNYANPEVLLAILDLLLFYLDQGVTIIRLDAIAYLWKESGTTCIHLPQTHRVVKLMRLILEAANPEVVLITETNVPHMENISYFGSYDYALKRTDEAHMVYQFPLAPLVLHTLVSGSAKRLTDWVEGLESTGIFFNFIASHDGIGMLPAHGILTDEEIQNVIDQVSHHGGLLSHRSNPDGSRTVYELNTTLYDALNDPNNPDPTVDINRFLASQVILMSLAGVPGIYYHSLFGSRNSLANVQKTGRARSINRKKFALKELESRLKHPKNINGKIFCQLRELLSIRTQQVAFTPYGEQETLKIDDRLFSLVRYAQNDGFGILVLVNISSEHYDVTINLTKSIFKNKQEMTDLISGEGFAVADGKLGMTLGPYQSMWLK